MPLRVPWQSRTIVYMVLAIGPFLVAKDHCSRGCGTIYSLTHLPRGKHDRVSSFGGSGKDRFSVFKRLFELRSGIMEALVNNLE